MTRVDFLLPAAACCSSLQTPGRADLLTALEVEDALEVDFLSHLLVPALEVVLVSGESVDQKVVFITVIHGPLQETAGDLHRDNCTVGNVVLYQLPELKITGLEECLYLEVLVTSEPGLALSSLSRSPAERWT